MSTALGFSYVRFSSPEQAKGDSLRRQTERTAEWCKRNNVRFNTNLTLRDLGVSAFKGEHRSNPKNALAMFLKAVDQGKVPQGSYLIIENLDRLSREDERTALRLWMDILDKGINIVQLVPETVFRHDKSDMMDIMRAIIELSRGHSESRMKSDRVGKAWRNRVDRTRKGEVILTHMLPGWIEIRDGKLTLIRERAAAVKQIYQLSAAGYGSVRIAKTLTAAGVRPFGDREAYTVTDEDGKETIRYRAKKGERLGSGQWNRCYVSQILMDERVRGTFQPRKGDRSKDGDPLPNYFPAAVTDEEWFASRTDVVKREKQSHRVNGSSKYVFTFGGMIGDARDGGPIYCGTRTWKGEHSRVLVTGNGLHGRIPLLTFPYPTFEKAILTMFAEIDPTEILGRDTALSEIAVLTGELERIEDKLVKMRAFMAVHEFTDEIGKQVVAETAHKKEVSEKLEEVRRRAATPVGKSWDEAKSLISVLENAEDKEDVRLRIRTAMSRIIEDIVVLIIPQGKNRVAFVQVNFPGGKQRFYVIGHKHPWKGRAGHWWCISKPFEKGSKGIVDLRGQEDQEEARAFVENLKEAGFPSFPGFPVVHTSVLHYETIPAE